MSRKSERLVNLTIALLATKRWLTKTQIFASIDGYEGEADAMERMFERDKDDLRNLGINIEIGSFDPLFEDEIGYRIRPENYRIDMPALTQREFALLSLASQAWKGAVLDATALKALVKLKSLGIDSDFDSIPAISPTLHASDSNLEGIIAAVAKRQTISFSYLNSEYQSETRVLEPYGVGTKFGFWYVAGRDLDRKQIRVFRLDRFENEVSSQGKAGSYAIPQNFAMGKVLEEPEPQQVATVKVRRDKAHALRAQASQVDEGEEWSLLTIPYLRESKLIRDVLWHGVDAVILSPESARDELIEELNELASNHG